MMELGGQHKVRGATPKRVALGYRGEQAGQAMRSKPVSSAPLCCLRQVLPPLLPPKLLPWPCLDDGA